MSSNGFVAMADRVFPVTDEGALNVLPSHTSLSSTSNAGSGLLAPPDSPGSSVSTRLQEEYDELLKYAVVMPTYNPSSMIPSALSDVRPSAAKGRDPPPQANPSTMSADTNATAAATATTKKQPPAAMATGHWSSSTVPPTVASKDIDHEPSQTENSYDEVNRDLFERCCSLDNHPILQPSHRRTNANQDSEDGYDHQQQKFQYHQSHGGGMTGDGLDQDGSVYSYTVTVDQDVSQMEALMDEWTAELKRKVLAEFSQTKIRILEHHRQQILKQRDVHGSDMRRQLDEAESFKELLHTYEQSIERKDQVIANLTASLQSHRDRMDMQRGFCEWKIKHNDARREAFASNLAYQHYERTLQKKVWDGWHSLVVTRWRQRVEKACQAKAQEVCIALTNDYETKLASLNETMSASRSEVNRLHQERNIYEETMKKAFMRGVCALNLEAMTMFHEGGPEQTNEVRERDNFPVGSSATVQQDVIYCSDPSTGPPPSRVVTGQSASQPAIHTRPSVEFTKPKTTGHQNAKVISAKVSARPVEVTRVASGPTHGLHPPMSSVIVERHHPITKQTIGQATASKYQNTGSMQYAVGSHKVTKNHGAGFPNTNPNIHTVKVVE